MNNDTITAIEGIRVGHAELDGVPSGCTVILPDAPAAAGVDIRGGAPGTYGADTLYPINLVGQVHGLFLSGGSAFGLSAADGVRRFLKERGSGFDTGHGLVPIVAGAILFDLEVNETGGYPDADLAYAACLNASSAPVREGAAGAGAGATVGKLFGFERCMKGGIGSCCIDAAGGLKVAALLAVNAVGDIFDPASGAKIAGSRVHAGSSALCETLPELLRANSLCGFPGGEGTVIGVVAVNARFNKGQLTKIAQMAHDGLARAIYPVHTQFDGDAVFALSCGDLEGVGTSMAGTLAATAASRAILRAVQKAEGLEGIPSFSDI